MSHLQMKRFKMPQECQASHNFERTSAILPRAPASRRSGDPSVRHAAHAYKIDRHF